MVNQSSQPFHGTLICPHCIDYQDHNRCKQHRLEHPLCRPPSTRSVFPPGTGPSHQQSGTSCHFLQDLSCLSTDYPRHCPSDCHGQHASCLIYQHTGWHSLAFSPVPCCSVLGVVPVAPHFSVSTLHLHSRQHSCRSSQHYCCRGARVNPRPGSLSFLLCNVRLLPYMSLPLA